MFAQVRFWSGPKRFPRALDFSESDQLHMDFVIAGTKLLAQLYGIEDQISLDEMREVLRNTVIPEFVPKKGT